MLSQTAQLAVIQRARCLLNPLIIKMINSAFRGLRVENYFLARLGASDMSLAVFHSRLPFMRFVAMQSGAVVKQKTNMHYL